MKLHPDDQGAIGLIILLVVAATSPFWLGVAPLWVLAVVLVATFAGLFMT